MKKNIFILVLTLLLFTSAFLTQFFIDDSLQSLKTQASQIQDNLNTDKRISADTINKISTLKNYWTEKESILCLLINHTELDPALLQITKLDTLALEDKYEEIVIETDVLLYYIYGYTHTIDFSLQNIF